MSTYDTAEKASQLFWAGRRAYLTGKPAIPPDDDMHGVWVAGWHEAAKADLRRTLLDVTAPKD